MPVRTDHLIAAWQDYFMSYILNLKTIIMGNLLYVIAVILIIGWLLGYFAFHVTSGFIHILLVIAVILFLLKLIGGRSSGV
jgi:hypothetical protein